MGRSKGWVAERTGRAPMPSPGRPQINQRPAKQAFWQCIARGLQSEDAARACGVSQPLGTRWFLRSWRDATNDLSAPVGAVLIILRA